MEDNTKTLKITLRDIRKRLGFSTIAMESERLGARAIAVIREAGIIRIEICGYWSPSHYDCHNPAQVSEIISECQKQGISIVSVHAPGIGFIYNTPYEELRKAVVKELAFCTRVAEEMGAGVFVTHLGMSGIDGDTERSITELLEQTRKSPIKIAIENGTDLKVFTDCIDRIGSDRLGLTVDIGHTRDSDGINPFVKKERAYGVMAGCKGRLLHLHLHDFTDIDHYPPFDGNVQWGEIFSALYDIGYKGEFMFEAVAKVSTEDTLKKTAAFPCEFVTRYGLNDL